MVALTLALLLSAAPDAPVREENPPPLTQPSPLRARTERSVLVPVLESALVNFMLASFNNLITRQPYAQITLATIASHLPPRSWTFDNDYFLVNQFGHPYQGAWPFIAARSSGLNFWWSVLFPFGASLAWELFFEIDPPSVNDQINSTLGGAFLGEALFRVAGIFLDPSSRLPPWLREVFAAVVAPPASLNRALFDDRLGNDGLEESLWYRASLGGGTFVQLPSGVVGGFFSAHLVYGAPTRAPDAPFSHFELRADLSISRTQVTGDFNLRGLLWGRHFHAGQLEGSAGIFGAYEYVAPRVLRASSVNLGGGALAQYAFSNKLALEMTAVASGIVFGAGGFVGANAIAQNDGRDYHIGPGFHAVAELSLIHGDVGMLSAGVRRWNFFGGVYAQPTGHDAITYIDASATVRLGPNLTATLEVVQAFRDARFDPVTITQSVTQFHFFVSWLFSNTQGGLVSDRHPAPSLL